MRNVMETLTAAVNTDADVVRGTQNSGDYRIVVRASRHMEQRSRSLVELFVRTVVDCHAHDHDHDIGATTRSVIKLFFEGAQAGVAELRLDTLHRGGEGETKTAGAGDSCPQMFQGAWCPSCVRYHVQRNLTLCASRVVALLQITRIMSCSTRSLPCCGRV